MTFLFAAASWVLQNWADFWPWQLCLREELIQVSVLHLPGRQHLSGSEVQSSIHMFYTCTKSLMQLTAFLNYFIYIPSSSLFSCARMVGNIMYAVLWDARSLRNPQFATRLRASYMHLYAWTKSQTNFLFFFPLLGLPSCMFCTAAMKAIRHKMHSLWRARFVRNNWGGRKLASRFWNETIDSGPFRLQELSDLQLFFNIRYYRKSSMHIGYLYFTIFNNCLYTFNTRY